MYNCGSTRLAKGATKTAVAFFGGCRSSGITGGGGFRRPPSQVGVDWWRYDKTRKYQNQIKSLNHYGDLRKAQKPGLVEANDQVPLGREALLLERLEQTPRLVCHLPQRARSRPSTRRKKDARGAGEGEG